MPFNETLVEIRSRDYWFKVVEFLLSMAINFDPVLANKIDPPLFVQGMVFCFSR